MINIVVTGIELIMIMLGVIAIYDARKIAKKWFSFSDKNSAAKWLKVSGFLLAFIGVLMLFFNK